MNKKATILILALVSCCCNITATAQNDSSWLDLGTLKLKRGLTQSIVIKGSDLEKMPSASLSEAINTWLYGVYSNDLSILYVVDGNLLSNVNFYSIYDIEEIIFVQNALIQTNGAYGQSQLVLITTKKNWTSKWGVTLAGQSGLVHRDFSQVDPGKNYSSNTNLYHQYYLGVSRNYNNVSIGVSADYLRDVLPSVKADSIHTTTPYNLNRFRLTGYFQWKPGKKNEIDGGLTYTPQKVDSAQYYTNPYTAFNANTHQSERAFAPFGRWHSEFIPDLKNDLSFAYLNLTGRSTSIMRDTNTQYSLVGPSPYVEAITENGKTSHILIRERLAYTFHAGPWNIEPSLNASYEHIKFYSIANLSTNTSLGPFGNNYYFATQGTGGKAELYFLTPSVNLNYKDVFDFQAGLLDNISSGHGVKLKRVFPFLNMTMDLLKLLNKDNTISLKLFGSYAQSCLVTLSDYQLSDLSANQGIPSSSFQYTDGNGPFNPLIATIYGSNAYMPVSFPTSYYWIWETGMGLSLLKDRLQINYNYERRRFQGATFGPIPSNPNLITYGVTGYPEFRSSTNYVGITTVPYSSKDLQWKSILNMACIFTKVYTGPSNYFLVQNGVGDYNSTSRFSWTGGWVNRFQFKDFSAGIDLLYHFHESAFDAMGVSYKINSLLLQNIYLGYRLHSLKAKEIEIYLDSRNLFQNNKGNLADGRRYFGIGGKLGI